MVISRVINGRVAQILFCILLMCKVCGNEVSSRTYMGILEELIQSLSEEMKKEEDLIYIGSGGSMHNKIEEIAIKFQCFCEISVDEARALEIKATNKLLSKINSNKEIRPFLLKCPFGPDQVEVSISFSKEDGSRFGDGSVAYVSLIKNRIGYYSDDEPDEPKPLLLLHEESYEEALKKCKEIE